MKFFNMERIQTSRGRARLVAYLACGFAFLYHFAHIFIFKQLNIEFMFGFNIASTILFAGVLVFVKLSKKSCVLPYIVTLVEVLIHQILADRFLGGTTSFHYFVLLMGLLPFLIFEKKVRAAVPFAVFCSAIYFFMEVFIDSYKPLVEISDHMILVIKGLNTGLFLLVLLCLMFIFTLTVTQMEDRLESEVKKVTENLQAQYKRNFDLQKNQIISLSNLVENRDADTGEHVRRTAEFVTIISDAARKSGYFPEIDEKFVEYMEKAAPLHDIGKIVVPDSILKKPGKLTPEEFIQIKRHTTEGERIVKEVLGENEDKSYVRIASDIATYHHERWDGKGYPYNKAGVNIPLSARIMALADVFDALVAPRCYKEPMSPEKAYSIITEESGTHFDPLLVRIFSECRSEVEDVVKRLVY